MTTARWGDVRLWLGVVLIVASMLVGAKVLTSGDDTVAVWRATRDLSVGAAPTGLAPVAVNRAVAADRYLAADQPVDGVLRTPVRAGELVARSAVAAPTSRPSRRVTLPVDPLHAPVDLQPGDLVDVWTTPAPAAQAVGEPRLVLAGATVVAVAADAVGASGESGVVIDVPEADVASVIAAARSGLIDLVSVPPDSQVAS